MGLIEGRTYFFRTPSLKSQTNHKQKSHMQEAQKPQITEKLLKYDTKSKITKITKKSQKKSCNFKITKDTFAKLRSDLPLGSTCFFAFKLIAAS